MTTTTTTNALTQLVPDYFPVDMAVREKQAKALGFVQRAIDRGYRDIVIEAPTGIGKSLIGAAVCFWASHSENAKVLEGEPGGYYLVTQKMLQDQLEEDFRHFKPEFAGKACLLKSSTDYPCDQFVNCMVGRSMKEGNAPGCNLVKEKMCHYMLARQWFIHGHMAVTNYPYFFTERTFIGQFPKKKVLIADECFPAGTLVETRRGPKKIERIKVGEEVLSYWQGVFVYRKVTNTFARGRKPILRVSTTYGDIRCTEEHPLLTTGGWRKAVELKIGSVLIGKRFGRHTREINDDQLQLVEVLNVDGVLQPGVVPRWQTPKCYDLEVEGTHNFVVRTLFSKSASAYSKTGVVVHNCHTLEGQILGFVEMSVTAENLREYASGVDMPLMEDKLDFCEWLDESYLPVATEIMEVKQDMMLANPNDRRAQIEFQKVQTHVGRIKTSIETVTEDPDNWVYWQEKDESGSPSQSVAKPLKAHPYAGRLIRDAASLRIYMSAYPGPKDTFCGVAGLDVEKVAWISLSSTFPKENRPVHMNFSGSMGRKSINDTLPRLLKDTIKILDRHPNEKGLIHCHSYKIGNELNAALAMSKHGSRLLFARNAAERNKVFEEHAKGTKPTVLLSPSMTEGFNLKDDLARFQIIAKVPYPYLGDPQVAAKKDADQDWYTLQTIQTIIQATGRIVRSETDYGETYILDEDFERLFVRNQKFFPKWWVESTVWPNGRPS